jgi:hypothetical protein
VWVWHRSYTNNMGHCLVWMWRRSYTNNSGHCLVWVWHRSYTNNSGHCLVWVWHRSYTNNRVHFLVILWSSISSNPKNWGIQEIKPSVQHTDVNNFRVGQNSILHTPYMTLYLAISLKILCMPFLYMELANPVQYTKQLAPRETCPFPFCSGGTIWSSYPNGSFAR